MLKVLERDGLSLDLLAMLSYRSELGISLKRNLHYFDKTKVMDEILAMREWYDDQDALYTLALDYRVKSIQSALAKFDRYYPDHQARKVFDDILGLRSLVDNYSDILGCQDIPQLRIVDMSRGKANDDGYRGVHAYFQIDNFHYPIEIQYNTYYDRQLNNWLHKYLYKKGYPLDIGRELRARYECGEIINENEFKEALDNVLHRG